MAQFNFTDWLPMPPWLGPPLPQAMGIYWPFAQNGISLPTPCLPSPYSSSTMTEDIEIKTPNESVSVKEFTTYDNTETVEFPDGFDPVTFMPRKIVIHRNAKVTK